MIANETEFVLDTPNQLKEYLANLPIDYELRFPSITSLEQDFAVIMVIYNTLTRYVLLCAYNKKLSGLPKKKVTLKTEDFTYVNHKETAFTLARYGILKETGLDCSGEVRILDPFQVENTNKDIDAEWHVRYTALFNEFSGKVKIPDEILDPKIKEYVWVKDFLLTPIFTKPFLVNGQPTKPHPQVESFKKFEKNKKSEEKKQESEEKVTFKSLLGIGRKKLQFVT